MIESPAHILPVATKACDNSVALVTNDGQPKLDELEQRVGFYCCHCSYAPVSF